MEPTRLQLSQHAGFDLQKLSRDYNGREAVSVARPRRWGNPFIVNDKFAAGTKVGGGYIAAPTVEDAVGCFRELIAQDPKFTAEAVADLRGKNLACWCMPVTPCHPDVLLGIANR